MVFIGIGVGFITGFIIGSIVCKQYKSTPIDEELIELQKESKELEKGFE